MELTFKSLRKMTSEQIDNLQFELVKRENLVAASYISDFKKFCDKKVEVFKGRKVPIGTVGTAFWLAYYDNSKYGDPWGIYTSHKVGIKTDSGDVYFTALENVRVI